MYHFRTCLHVYGVKAFDFVESEVLQSLLCPLGCCLLILAKGFNDFLSHL